MITLIEKTSPYFDVQEARRNFEKQKENLGDTNGFEKILFNSRFFNIYNHGYVGSVFIYEGEDGKNYIGGYALRKHHQDVVEAIRQTTATFDEVYAHTTHLNAVLALKEAGFKWLSREQHLLKKERKNYEYNK